MPCLTENERRWIETDRTRRAYLIWTCKEAYIKAIGSSIAVIPMCDLEFTFENDCEVVRFKDEAGRVYEQDCRWYFKIRWVQQNVVAVICSDTSLEAVKFLHLSKDQLDSIFSSVCTSLTTLKEVNKES